jgi:aspartate aminotransferase
VREQERIASKIHKFQPSLTLRLKQLAAERRAQNLPVYDFGLGETKGPLAEHIRAAAAEAYLEGRTVYGDPAGLLELRQEVLRWLDLEEIYGPESVVITTGAKQSLFNTFLSVCNPADCVLFDSAPWVSYQPLAVASSAFPVMVLPAADHSNRLKITAEDLRRNLKLRPDARLFLLNNPCNPTGQLYDADEIEALLRVCIAHRVYFVLDRLYWRLLYDGRDYPAPRLDDETRPWIVHIDGISKNFRRTGGIRIGWSVAAEDLAAAMTNLQSHYTSGPSMPAQYAALAAVRHPYDWELRDYLEANRDLLWERAGELADVEVWPTPASFYSFWDASACLGKRTPDGNEIRDADDLAEYLLRRAGVVTASGTAFMQDGFLRISFAVKRDELASGISAAARALAELGTPPPSRGTQTE